MNNFVYLNGEYLKDNEAKISVFDRGFIFGDGIYEVAPIYLNSLVDLNECVLRLMRSARALELDICWGLLGEKDYEFLKLSDELLLNSKQFEQIKAKLKQIAKNLISKNKINQGGFYLQITRGVAPRDFAFTDVKPTVMAFTYSQNIDENPQTAGVKLASFSDIRWKRRDVKSLNLLAQCMARQSAKNAGADYALLVRDGYINECDAAGFFIIKDGALITKPLSNEILPSIRRANIIKIAQNLGLKVIERSIKYDELFTADGAFMCAATILLLPVISCDDRQIKRSELCELIRKEYLKKLKDEVDS